MPPYPRALERFPRLRQSALATFDRCALSSNFDLTYRRDWSGHPQARGQVFHRTAAECLRTMYRQNEWTIPPSEALEILHEALRQTHVDSSCGKCGAPAWTLPTEGELPQIECENGHRHGSNFVNIPMDQVRDLVWVTKKFAKENSFDIDNLVDIEQRLMATLRYPDPEGGYVERTLSGALDALFVIGEAADHAVVLDWKDTWGLPAPTDLGFDGYFQQRMYAWLVMRNYPTVQRVTLRELYVRFGAGDDPHRPKNCREADIYRDELDDVERELSALAERFDRAYEQSVFPPSPGRHCLAGDTRFLTDQGVRTLRDACGESVQVLDRHGEWVAAEIHSFGLQRLLRVIFDDGTVVRATPDHRWWQMAGNTHDGWRQTDERITTVELDRAPVVRHAELPDLDAEGIRHGQVYGDGAVSSVRLSSDRPTALSPVGTLTRELMCVQLKPATAPVLRPDHRERLRPRNQMRRMYREVVAIEQDEMEEVFCAVVPGSESFTLASGITTSNCQMCPLPERCPIFPGVRIEGRIQNEADALRFAKEASVARAARDGRLKEMKAWTSVRGPVSVSDHKGPRQWGFRESSRRSTPKKEVMEAALRQAEVEGVSPDLDSLYRDSKVTRFEEHTPKRPDPEVSPEEESAALTAALEASVSGP